MADKLVVNAGLVAAALRLPGTAQENQIIVNAGPGTAYMGQTSAVNYLTGTPLPVNGEYRLWKNGLPLYCACGLGTSLGASTPAVPASTVAANNTFGQAVGVTLSGGTISAVAIGGVTQSVNGVNTIAGTFIVPAGSSITLTYTVAPTWTWQYGLPANLQVSPGVQAT